MLWPDAKCTCITPCVNRWPLCTAAILRRCLSAENSELMLNWKLGVSSIQFSSVPPLILRSASTVSSEVKLKDFSEQVEKYKPT